MHYKNFILLLFLLELLFIGCSKSESDEDTPSSGTKCIFQGSFIQPWFVHEWSGDRWDKEMKMLKDAGVQYLIYGPAMNTDDSGAKNAIYPSSINNISVLDNSLERCLASAQKYGIKIFIGINFNNLWWSCDYSSEWLIEQMKEGNRVIDELIELYKNKYKDSFYGWYWTWEIANVGMETEAKKNGIIKALNTNIDHINEVTPNMPVMLSPFMNYTCGTAVQYGDTWKYLFMNVHFREGDIFVPQDCIGAGGLNLNNVVQWFKELKRAADEKKGLLFWANTEIFTQNFTTAPVNRVEEQIEKVKPFVSGFICFAYSHYYSPYVVSSQYNDAYLYYMANSHFPMHDTPKKPSSVRVDDVSDGVRITWNMDDSKNSVGAIIYKNNAFYKQIQFTDTYTPLYFFDKSGNINARYDVSFYNINGVESERVSAMN